MKLDKNYKVPFGFYPHMNYPDGVHPVPVVGLCAYMTSVDRELLFNIKNDPSPTLPFIAFGEIEHMGWDINTPWAIDADKQCWMGGGHGEAMSPVSVKELMDEAESDEDKEEIAEDLGMEPPELSWQKKARAAGWGPKKENMEKWKKLLEEYKDLAYEDAFDGFLETKDKKRQCELEELFLNGLMQNEQ